MRVLSPASDVLAPLPPRHEKEKSDSMANETTTETTGAKSPNAAATSTIPIVMLDVDVVSHNMAARLCMSFLSHVLFLKNQVPFPIVQLARMPTRDNASRAVKKRHELLNAFDTLASHLYTTFVALSTALALRGLPENVEAGAKEALSKHGVDRAFFAVALGPTVGTARSRVIVSIDGLETRVWGLREDDDSDDASERDDDESVSDTGDGDERSNGDESDDSSEQEEACDSDDVASPPRSRSPSPAVSSDSDVPPSTSSQTMLSKAPPPPAEDPESVRAAERLLSRTLASACAEDDGQGLASEMAPTQIHVLLRAPRRFNHPCWIPRQNLCASLDGCLADFLAESAHTPASHDATAKKRTKASKVQGVWVKSRAGGAEIGDSEKDLGEDDELIWWCWDGKLVGFADW